jgi:tRNA A-37 threonylcarbamoyl transferase component Bud32
MTMETDTFSEATTVEKEVAQSDSSGMLDRDPLVGILLDGRYAIQRKLGQGGFGSVYLATDEKMMSRRVIAKVLHVEKLNQGWVVKKFRQEVEALARIDHPSVVGVLDWGSLPTGIPYIIMQYVDGVSLRSMITVEGMDLRRAANIIRQVGRALGAAHDRGILHRDLKPENIMLQQLAGGDEQVKIIDFGIAKVKDSVISTTTEFGGAMGTAAYMSPEQLSAKPVTPATDVYSFGIIAYEMLTGRRPMNPDSAFQLLEMQRSGIRVKPRDLRPNIEEPAETIVLKALSFEPKDRYQRVRDFGDLLAAALVGDDEQTELQSQASAGNNAKGFVDPWAVTTPVTEVLRRPADKRATVIAAACLTMVAFAIAGVWFARIRSKATPVSPPAQPATVSPAGPEQSLVYWLTVQKMLNHKPLGKPIESAGNIIFGNGWKFRFNVSPNQSGALYLLNVGPGKNGELEYDILFPSPTTFPLPQNDQLDPRLQANQTMQSGWNRFVEHTGIERLWIIWSARPIPELDNIFNEAARDKQNPGVVTNPSQIAQIETYLKRHDAKPPDKEDQPSENKTSIKGWGEVMVNLVELKHEEV